MSLAWVWNRIDVRGPYDCWPALHTSGKECTGYGQIAMSHAAYSAHRLAWIASGHTIPPGGIVCHHCDFPHCCNPAHLYAGTARSNRMDQNRSSLYRLIHRVEWSRTLNYYRRMSWV